MAALLLSKGGQCKGDGLFQSQVRVKLSMDERSINACHGLLLMTMTIKSPPRLNGRRLLARAEDMLTAWLSTLLTIARLEAKDNK
eukprot:12415621-Karenia_brevis.AAC.1